MTDKLIGQNASSFQRKLADRYWDFHSFLKEYVRYELKANSITSHSLTYMYLEKILRMK